MLAALARHRALTRDQLTGLFFGSKRRCQAALSRLKQPELVRHVIICRTVIPSRHCDVRSLRVQQSSPALPSALPSTAMRSANQAAKSYLKDGGECGIRTRGGGFADLCLTTWLTRPAEPIA